MIVNGITPSILIAYKIKEVGKIKVVFGHKEHWQQEKTNLDTIATGMGMSWTSFQIFITKKPPTFMDGFVSLSLPLAVLFSNQFQEDLKNHNIEGC